MIWLLLFRLFAILVAGFGVGAGLVRIYQWFPLRRVVGWGPSLFFAGVVLTGCSSLYFRFTALVLKLPFSGRDAISTLILGLFLAGLGASPAVLAQIEVQEGDEP